MYICTYRRRHPSTTRSTYNRACLHATEPKKSWAKRCSTDPSDQTVPDLNGSSFATCPGAAAFDDEARARVGRSHCPRSEAPAWTASKRRNSELQVSLAANAALVAAPEHHERACMPDWLPSPRSLSRVSRTDWTHRHARRRRLCGTYRVTPKRAVPVHRGQLQTASGVSQRSTSSEKLEGTSTVVAV